MLRTYREALPDWEHHYLLSGREGASSIEDLHALGIEALHIVPRHMRGVAAAVARIRRAAESYQVIHAHSTIGGVVARAAMPRRHMARLVYTPHCFASERQDISKAARFATLGLERLLVSRTDAFAACSVREQRLAQGIARGRQVELVPSVAPTSSRRTNSPAIPTYDVYGVGRLSPQKDPSLFAAVVTRLRQRRPTLKALWIGGGDHHLEAALTSAGVEVTGWLANDAAMNRTDEARIYLHTAAWEGFPLSVLEATSLKHPTIVRDIAPFAHINEQLRRRDASGLASAVDRLLEAPHAQVRNLELWGHELRTHTLSAVRSALLSTYTGDSANHGLRGS